MRLNTVFTAVGVALGMGCVVWAMAVLLSGDGERERAGRSDDTEVSDKDEDDDSEAGDTKKSGKADGAKKPVKLPGVRKPVNADNPMPSTSPYPTGGKKKN